MPIQSPAPQITQTAQSVPLGMVGGNNFGRYPKISAEQTFNFIVSDNALVPYAGYKNVRTQSPNAEGRGCILALGLIKCLRYGVLKYIQLMPVLFQH